MNTGLIFAVIGGERPRSHEGIDMQAVYAAKSRSYLTAKRVFDIVASLLALILLSPVFLITAIAIKIEDGGSVIFTQKRTGQDGKPFMMYKFRSMVPSAGNMHKDMVKYNQLDGPAFKMRNDPRVTRIGHLIRRTSIDELPQLVNILKGDMSIVGPRPLPVYETEQCTDYQNQRQIVKPGLTCSWQVSGRNHITFTEWMEMDLQYIEEMSVKTDLKLIWKTFGAVITMTGAY